MRDKMKKLLVFIVFAITSVLILSGCQAAAQLEAEGSEEQPLIAQFRGIIDTVDGNEMLVYAFEGYNGLMVARWDEETKIDESLKPLIKPENLISFTTSGMMTMSIPPQVIATSIDFLMEGVVFEGTVVEVSEDSLAVSTTYPRTDKLIARIIPETVFAEGVSEDLKVGNTVRFETNGIMQPSEPPQINVIRFTKNEVLETASSDFIQKKIDEGIDFYAIGNEPSWSLDVKLEEGLKFTTLSGFELYIPLSEPIKTGEDGSFEFSGETGPDLEAGTIIISVIKEECTDNMSGEVFTHKVSIDAKGGVDNDFQTYEGCGKYLLGLN
jgi:uncharacterized membrane protein